jgi:putative tryptophan/tyrosine transport system substrate-binding protein
MPDAAHGMKRRGFLSFAAGVALWPGAAWAQQPGRSYRLAIAHPTRSVEQLHTAGAARRFTEMFFAELRRRGYAEGQNLIVEAYSGEGKSGLFPALAERIVASKPDAIFALGTLAQSFKSVATNVPIVVAIGDDVLASGFVTNLAHPGGNITGVMVTPGAEIWGKRLALLLQAQPEAKRIAYLATRAVWESPSGTTGSAVVRNVAQPAGITLVPALIDTAIEPEYRRAFASIASEKVDAVLVGDGAEHYGFAPLLAALTKEARLPSLFPDRSFTDEGGLISYGVDFPDLFRHSGDDVAKVLSGADPGDIPFYQPTRYELVINLKTAKSLGIELPPLMIAGADDVIE